MAGILETGIIAEIKAQGVLPYAQTRFALIKAQGVIPFAQARVVGLREKVGLGGKGMVGLGQRTGSLGLPEIPGQFGRMAGLGPQEYVRELYKKRLAGLD